MRGGGKAKEDAFGGPLASPSPKFLLLLAFLFCVGSPLCFVLLLLLSRLLLLSDDFNGMRLLLLLPLLLLLLLLCGTWEAAWGSSREEDGGEVGGV